MVVPATLWVPDLYQTQLPTDQRLMCGVFKWLLHWHRSGTIILLTCLLQVDPKLMEPHTSPLKWSPPLPDARNIMSSYLVIKQCNSTSNLPQARQGKARHPALIFSFYMNWALLLCFLFMLCWRTVLLCLCCIVLLRFWPFLFCVTTEIY